MTLTAPVPILDTRGRILAGVQPVTATVHVAAQTFRPGNVDASVQQLETAQAIARRAIAKNLDPAALALRDGRVLYQLDPEPHGDGYLLRARWEPTCATS